MSGQSLAEKIQGKTPEIQMIYIAEEIDRIGTNVEEIKRNMSNDYLKTATFGTYKETQQLKEAAQDKRISNLEKIIYGLIGMIVIAVIGALINLVVK